ncbi:MAG: DUF4292 domain-containing protein [Ferruginibacter sp.]
MKYFFYLSFVMIGAASVFGCRSTKKISRAIATKDSTVNIAIVTNRNAADSILGIKKTMDDIRKHHIDFQTFSAKIKVDYEDSKGKQPDVNAYVRIFKDSLIWIDIRSVFLDVEALKIMITKDSVIVVNKLQKEVQLRSIDYLQDLTDIPFDLKTLQDLFVGNPVFMDGTVISYRKTDNNQVLLSTVGKYFKNLLTLSADNNVLLHSKLDDVDVAHNRTADITYDEFDNKKGFSFSTYREITVSEKNRLDIRLNYKQYDFNKELTVSFVIPKNYKRT